MTPVRPPLEASSAAPRRLIVISGLAVVVGLLSGGIAALLIELIRLITNLSYFHRVSIADANPWAAGTTVGTVIAPLVGAVLIGFMARWGAEAIRGHGIPEVMDRVLNEESRIPAKLTLLKPLSAAIAIGTGGPFGTEGPIIATGGALGSLVGQFLHVTADERKVLLAAGAAAGMAANFGTPVAAVLLAVELLLFEYRAASIIPVALAASAAMVVRTLLFGGAPVFPMPTVSEPGATALVVYAVFGAFIGAIAAGITRMVYAIEDQFERLPIHWMWWPLIGAMAVSIGGVIEPRMLGVGYSNIIGALSGRFVLSTLALIILVKFIAWAIYLASGTSGGTLAPLFTFGSGIGALVGSLLATHLPELGVSAPVAALVGMAAIFAGASRALLASVVFAFETTRQPLGLLPLLVGCSTAYLAARLLMRHSIMTEKLARRGVLVQEDYAADYLAQIPVRAAMATSVVTLPAEALASVVLTRLHEEGFAGHQGFPVVAEGGRLVGVLTRRDLAAPSSSGALRLEDLVRRTPVTVGPDASLREAADIMVREAVGRLPVVSSRGDGIVIGMLSRSDLLRAHAPRLHAAERRAAPVGLRHAFFGGRETGNSTSG